MDDKSRYKTSAKWVSAALVGPYARLLGKPVKPATLETKLICPWPCASNTGSTAITGRAVYNVSPDVAGRYFIKIDCFCFTEQTLKAGETVDMPVSYYIDPAIMDDPVAKKIDEITLSYTFYPVDKPVQDRLSAATNRNSLKDRG